MISKCAVNGTQVEFQCSGAMSWYKDSTPIPDSTNMETITVEANMDGDTGLQNFTITCDSSLTGYENAELFVVGKLLFSIVHDIINNNIF